MRGSGGRTRSRHVVATVEHVIGCFGRKAFMKTLTNKRCIFLNTVAGCEHHLRRPAFRRKWPLARPALDEICLLEIPQASDQFVLSCLINDLDCYKICECTVAIYQGLNTIFPIELMNEFETTPNFSTE